MLEQYILSLLNARTQGHILHLQTKSYAQHMALGDFYEEIGDMADELAEVYQGQYGLIAWPAQFAVKTSKNAESLLEGLREATIDVREDTDGAPHIQNLLDGVTALIDKTLYKLKNLK